MTDERITRLGEARRGRPFWPSSAGSPAQAASSE